MANNSIDFEISIRDAGSGALRTVSVAAKKADEAIAQITQSASKAEGGLRNMAGASIVLEAGIKSIQTLQGVIGGAISQYNSFDTAIDAPIQWRCSLARHTTRCAVRSSV